MMKKLTIITTVVVLFSFANIAYAALSIASVSIPSSVNQGDSFTLSASISGSSVSSVSATLSLPTGISCTPTGSQSVSLDNSGKGTASWSCTGDAAGDYTNKITVSVTGTDSSTGGSVSDNTQTGLKVLSPASLTASSTISSTSVTEGNSVTFTVGVNNAGDLSTTYSISISCPTGLTCSPTSVASNEIAGNSLENNAITVTGNAAGTYTITATISGGNGQTLTTSKSLTVNAATTEETTTPVTGPTVNVTTPSGIELTLQKGKATISIPSIAAGKSATVDIQKTEDVAFRKIIVYVKNAVNNIQITVNKLDAKPAVVTQEVTGKVYHYINVSTNVTNVDTKVNQTIVRFEVTKSWIDENNINRTTIALQRYNETAGAWQKLQTTEVTETDTEILYEAISPGLSVFAITGEARIPAEEQLPTEEVPTKEVAPEKKGKTGLIIIIVILVAIIGGVVFYLYKTGVIKLEKLFKRKSSWDELKKKYSYGRK